MSQERPEYDAERDGLDSFHLALRMIALRRGARQFATLWEMYTLESWGCIP